jgi:allantoin racemase
MKIKVIVPLVSDVFNEEVLQEVRNYAGEGVAFDVENLDYGPASIECHFDEAFAIPDILNKVQKAAEVGFDGVFIDCFGDPGVKAAREAVDIPVCGAFEPSLLLAAGLGQHLGVVTVLRNVVPIVEDLVKMLGFTNRVVSIRQVDMPVLGLEDRTKLENALYHQGLEAIKKDGVHVLILGCTGMMGVAKNLHKRLKTEGYDVPVIDPAFAAVKFVESYITMGVKHSRLTYMVPPDKPRKWYG